MAIQKKNGVEAAGVQLLLNKMNSTAQLVRLGSLIQHQKGCTRARYDFATSGGAVGTIALLDGEGLPVKLPNKAIITNAIIDVITQPTSASTPTIAITVQSANDILTATAIASLTTGVKQGTPANTVGTAIKMTAENSVSAVIAGTTLTAGKFMVLIDYVVSE